MKSVVMVQGYETVSIAIDGETVAECSVRTKPHEPICGLPSEHQPRERMYVHMMPVRPVHRGDQDVYQLRFDAEPLPIDERMAQWRDQILAALAHALDVNHHIGPSYGYVMDADKRAQHEREKALRDGAMAFGGHFTAWLQILLAWLEHEQIPPPWGTIESPAPDITPAGVPQP